MRTGGARRPHRSAWLLPLAAAAAIVAADLSGYSKAEVERIWLPFTGWLMAGTALIPATDRRTWLAVQAAVALTGQSSAPDDVVGGTPPGCGPRLSAPSGCHSCSGLPSGSVSVANLPFGYVAGSTSTGTPALRSCSTIASRSATRKLIDHECAGPPKCAESAGIAARTVGPASCHHEGTSYDSGGESTPR